MSACAALAFGMQDHRCSGISAGWLGLKGRSRNLLVSCWDVISVRRFVLGSVMSFQTPSSKLHVVVSSCVETRTELLRWDLVSRGLGLGSCVLRRFACRSVRRARSTSVVGSGFWDVGFRDSPIRHSTFRRGQLSRQELRFQFPIPNPRTVMILKETSMSGVFDDLSVVGSGIWDLVSGNS